VCVSGGGETAGGWVVVSSSRGWGEEGEGRQYTRREILEQFPTTEVECGLLLLIHILWALASDDYQLLL
jgi:hypothetical protein